MTANQLRHILTLMRSDIRSTLAAAIPACRDIDNGVDYLCDIRDALDHHYRWSRTPHGHAYFSELSYRYCEIQEGYDAPFQPLPCPLHTP